MTILKVLHYPDQRLKSVAKPVLNFDKKLSRLADDMLETMYSEKGIGLAAVQVNVLQRVVVMDLSEEKNKPIVFINPEIIGVSKEIREYNEGCLSVPGVYEKVQRPAMVNLRYQRLDGKGVEDEADELLSVCIQHEIDHLEGVVFLDRLSRLKQEKIIKRLTKERKKQFIEV